MSDPARSPSEADLLLARDVAARNRRVGGGLADVVSRVPAGAWDAPTPCDGWSARDVVAHLLDWMPGLFFGLWDVAAPPGPDPAEDPRAAWTTFHYTMQAVLEDPATATRRRDSPFGEATLAEAFQVAALADQLVHTWDVAVATGQAVALDPDELARLRSRIGTVDDGPMRASGHFGPVVDVPADVDDQTAVLAWFGRDPAWTPAT